MPLTKSKPTLKPAMLVAAATLMLIFIVSECLFRSAVPALFAPLALFPDDAMLSDGSSGGGRALADVWMLVVVVGFTTLAFLAWTRKNAVFSRILCGVTLLWAILLIALYFRTMHALDALRFWS